jgi:nucleoside-diphosphate-sugar epimerase/carbamoylphosphate synthase large subunit
MKSIKVGIGAIGSGVGQSVVNSCNLSRLPIKTVGLGTNPMAFGLFECNEYEITDSFYDPGYVQSILEVCRRRQINLLIPGHDDEAQLLAENERLFCEAGVGVVVSGPRLFELCRNKEKMSSVLNRIAPVFVRSYSKASFLRALDDESVHLPAVAKPIRGFASKGVAIIQCRDDATRIGNDFVFQELAIPHRDDPFRESYLEGLNQGINPQIAEISIQLVANRNGSLMGRTATYNKLSNGVPIEILPYENQRVWKAVDRIYPTLVDLGLRGPLNLQGRVTDDGLKLFEMNARFTGITGLRARLGFNEVEACIKHWTSGQDIYGLSQNPHRFGIRQTADKAVSFSRSPEVQSLHKRIGCTNVPHVKGMLITGTTGVIGGRLIRSLASVGGYALFTLDRNKDLARQLHGELVKDCYDWDDFVDGRFTLAGFDRLCHLAAARPHHGASAIAESLKRTFELFQRAAEHGLHDIVYISSQSVYGTAVEPPWHESQQPAPETPYAQSKLAGEFALDALKREYPELNHVSLRMATITGADKNISNYEAIAKICGRLIRREKVVVRGGEQRLERIDVDDAVEALSTVLCSSSSDWKNVYNVGTNHPVMLKDIITHIETELRTHGYTAFDLEIQASTNEKSFGMDSSLFNADFSWKPTKDMSATVRSLITDLVEGES